MESAVANDATGIAKETFPPMLYLENTDPQGYICCPYFPQFALGISGSSLSILTRNDSDLTQIWELSYYDGGVSLR